MILLNDQTSTVIDLIDEGRYPQALGKISDFNEKMEFERQILSSQIYQEKWYQNEAKDHAEQALIIAKKKNQAFEKVIALLNLAQSTIIGGPFDHLPELIKQANENFALIQQIDERKMMYLEAFLETTTGAISFYVGDKQKGIEALEKAVSLWNELDLKSELARAYQFLSYLYSPETAISFLQKASSIWEPLGNLSRFAWCICAIGSLHQAMGDFNNAITTNQKALNIFNELGEKYGIANACECLGHIALSRGDPKEAINNLNRAVLIWQDLKNPGFEQVTHNFLGQAYFQMGNMKQAISHHKVSLTTRENLRLSSDFMVGALLGMIRASLALGQISNANKYNNQLQAFHKTGQTKTTKAYSQLAGALILKTSKRLRDKMKAQALLEQISIDDPNLVWSIKILTLKNLADLLLLEIEFDDSPELLGEVTQLIEQIMKVAKTQHLFSVEVDAMILQSKLYLIQGHTDKAQDHLKMAKKIAIKHELGQMITLVVSEQENLKNNFKKWLELTNSNIPFRERLEQVELKDYMDIAMELRDRSQPK